MPTPSTPPARTGLIEYDHPASPQVARWIRKTVIPANTDKELGRCYKLEVKHFSVNNKPQGDVGQIPIPDSFSVDGIDHLVSEIVTLAQEDANNLHQGIQKYAVFARFKGDMNYTPRCYFRVSAQEEYDPESAGGDPSEPANAQGLVAQLMRHNESIIRTSVMNTSYLLDTLRQENASQRVLLDRQAEQAVETGALIQEMLDNATGRRLSEREAENKQAMMTGVFEHLKLLFPVILNKLAGQKITPETDQSFTLLASLFESLSLEQQEVLCTKFLTQPQAMVFGEFLATYDKRKKALASGDNGSKPAVDVARLFEPIREQVAQSDKPSDPKLALLESKAKSFKTLFDLPKLTGPIRPAKE